MQESANIKLLLHNIAEGNERAFREIFNTHSGKVYNYALKLTRKAELAEEIVQDVFLKIWVHRETLPEIENFPAYLYSITRNHTFNILKRIALEEKAKVSMKQSLNGNGHNQTEEAIFLQESEHILEQALNNLPLQQRTVFTLCHSEGLKYEEAAQRLHISPLTVKTHMQHALRSIRKHMSTALNTAIFLILLLLR